MRKCEKPRRTGQGSGVRTRVFTSDRLESVIAQNSRGRESNRDRTAREAAGETNVRRIDGAFRGGRKRCETRSAIGPATRSLALNLPPPGCRKQPVP